MSEDFPEPIVAPRPDTPAPSTPNDDGAPIPVIAPRPDTPMPQQ